MKRLSYSVASMLLCGLLCSTTSYCDDKTAKKEELFTSGKQTVDWVKQQLDSFQPYLIARLADKKASCIWEDSGMRSISKDRVDEYFLKSTREEMQSLQQHLERASAEWKAGRKSQEDLES